MQNFLGHTHRKLINAVHTYYVVCHALVYVTAHNLVPAHNLVRSFQLMLVIGTSWFAVDVAEAWIYTDGK